MWEPGPEISAKERNCNLTVRDRNLHVRGRFLCRVSGRNYHPCVLFFADSGHNRLPLKSKICSNYLIASGYCGEDVQVCRVEVAGFPLRGMGLRRYTHLSDDETVAKMGYPAYRI